MASMLISLMLATAAPPCAIIGDSIAVGLSQVQHGCTVNARVGRSAGTIARQRLPGHYAWAVISAGSNNPTDPRLRSQLETIRRNLRSTNVVWVLPRHPRAASLVRSVAVRNRDGFVDFVPSRDGVHPRSYQSLMRSVRTVL